MAGTGAKVVRARALVFLLAAAMAAVVLVTFGGAPAGAVVPGANGKIFFSSDRDGDSEIYSMYPNGKGLKKLTNNKNVSDDDPAVSPDGSKVVFVSSRNVSNFDGNTEIYVMNADGTDQKRLTNDPGGNNVASTDARPTFSPDGTKIAWEHERDIYLMNADGTGTPSNLTGADWIGFDSDPAFSPDGDQIAFTSNRPGAPDYNMDIYVMDTSAATNGATRLTEDLALDSEPSWSPDGSKIAFQSGRGSGFDVYVMDASGANETLLADATSRDEMPVFSPDGQKMVFSGTPTSYPEIYVTDSDPATSDTPYRLTRNGVYDAFPDWGLVPRSGGECTVTGTPGDDVITPGSTPGSTSGVDVICGLGGNDTIDAGEGDDTVRGGDGNDVVTGGAGEDELFGEAGKDRLLGGDDGDHLVGGSGSDRLFGEAGGDALDAKDTIRRNDKADGGTGDDVCAADRYDRRIRC